ncbi:hypothetical protein BDV97DRAFT_399202 [Delphinella strobiligena]|nr:hypothetical protein BDV97DRAFT_399202 [Delphinella strobiligena]
MMRLFATLPTLLLICGALASPFSLEGRSSAPTCVKNASNGTTYQATSGQYEISCGVDYAGGDKGMAWTTSFGACIQTCDSTAGCIDVSYVNGACYMKSTLGSPSSNSGVWTATSTTSRMDTLCINGAYDGTEYETSNNATFEIQCGKEMDGGILSTVAATSFEACMDTCSTTDTCVAVSYTTGYCYLKNTIVPSTTASWMNTAILATISQVVSEKTALTCVENASDGVTYQASNGSSFQIYCSTDFYGGDMSSADTASYADCIDLCSETTGCTDISFVAPACYLKSTLTSSVTNTAVWAAKLVAAAPAIMSSSSTSSITTSSSLLISSTTSSTSQIGSTSSTSPASSISSISSASSTVSTSPVSTTVTPQSSIISSSTSSFVSSNAFSTTISSSSSSSPSSIVASTPSSASSTTTSQPSTSPSITSPSLTSTLSTAIFYSSSSSSTTTSSTSPATTTTSCALNLLGLCVNLNLS